MPRESQNTALVIIDVQEGFDDPKWGRRNNPQAEENIAAILAVWRQTERPIFHVRHISVEPGSVFEAGKRGNLIKQIVAPCPGGAGDPQKR